MAMVRDGSSAGLCAFAVRHTSCRRAHWTGAIHRLFSIAFAISSVGSASSLMKNLLDAADFLRRERRKMRYGQFSREPLELLRLEWKANALECDWLMRPADQWDVDLPARVVEENQTVQALRDALTLRNIVFESFPRVDNAELRVFRIGADSLPELVMSGSVVRTNEVFERVASIAMRARLCGFRFTQGDGSLQRLTPLGCS